MWNLISGVREGRAIILTTHSMEEADALSTRIGIMKHGQLVCLGASQHLKNKFGSGYHLLIKTGRYHEQEAKTDVERFIETQFFNAQLVEKHGTLFHYQLPQEDLSLALVFAEIEKNKHSLNIVDYSVSQTNLEQIFLDLTREELEDDSILQMMKKKSCWSRFCCCCK